MAQQEKPQSFKDHDFFPPFRECPGELVWDDRYFTDSDPDPNVPQGGATKRKHWCLLGAIIQTDTFICSRVVAQDYTGHKFVVAFYPNDQNDMPRLLENFKVGNTIAVFYPLVHNFLDGRIGVRVEETDEVLIIPLGISDVIKMNEQVIEYTPGKGNPRKCHGCDEVKQGLNMCASCTIFYYCNKDCQTKAWCEKDHKKHCKVLKDENIRYMNFLKYSSYAGSVSFR
ncbi:hypothetical protein GGR53DRAFT_480560 [Hypoxylon sp. FL1150]|nr:hypothetical protein GGR53DRAFT_480560 [Hypoxylon sp. FL1150]